MEKAAAEGCRAICLGGVHEVRSDATVTVGSFAEKVILQICRLKFCFLRLDRKKSMFENIGCLDLALAATKSDHEHY